MLKSFPNPNNTNKSSTPLSPREESSVNLLGVSEEARIRADKETQESWEVVLNNKIPDVTDEDQLVFFEVRRIFVVFCALSVL